MYIRSLKGPRTDNPWMTFFIGQKHFMPWAGFEPTSLWLPVGCDHHYTMRATMLATWPIWIANGNFYVVILGQCFSPTRWHWINRNDDLHGVREKKTICIQVKRVSRAYSASLSPGGSNMHIWSTKINVCFVCYFAAKRQRTLLKTIPNEEDDSFLFLIRFNPVLLHCLRRCMLKLSHLGLSHPSLQLLLTWMTT